MMPPLRPCGFILAIMAKALAQSPVAASSPPPQPGNHSNGTLALLRERELLLARLIAIDSEIDRERDLKRRTLTESYERAMRALDDEFSTTRGRMGGARDGAAADLQQGLRTAAAHGSEHGTGHQDIAHQDISVTMLHIDNDAAVLIDQDGDGKISRDEVRPVVRAVHRDAALWQAAGPALLGCSAGILFYLLIRCIRGNPIVWGRARSPHATGHGLGRQRGEAAGVARRGVAAECAKRKGHAAALATAC